MFWTFGFKICMKFAAFSLGIRESYHTLIQNSVTLIKYLGKQTYIIYTNVPKYSFESSQ